MARSLRYKIFSPEGEYLASAKYPEDAAAVVALRGDGGSVRIRHAKRFTVFVEGRYGIRASESYDDAAAKMIATETEIQRLENELRRRGWYDEPTD